ncbi:hypothetical protein GCM10023339_73540 [Alloalcanivorax gelatiniphagus]
MERDEPFAFPYRPAMLYYIVVNEAEGLPMSVTTVRLQTDIEQRLEAIAQRLQRSKGWVINQAVAEYIEKEQREQERWRQTLEAMESAANGKVAGADEVHAWLQSWGTENEREAPDAGNK